jgi:signal transduction histidine kinase
LHVTAAPQDARLKEALLESLAVSRGGARLRTAAILISALPVAILLDMPLLLAWVAALVAWNNLLVPRLERRWVRPLLQEDVRRARLRRASMVAFGLSLTQVLPMAAWGHGSVFAAVVATAWALSSATQVFVYYSRDRLLLASGIAPIVTCALVGPALSAGGLTWEAASMSLFMLIALAAGGAFVGRSDSLIAQAAEEAAARRTAEAANSAKSRFIANMHHELRTPLNAIIGYSEMLRESALEERRQADVSDLDRVLAAARLQLMMIGDLLAFSELQDGRLELELHDFDPAALARETAAALRVGVEANNNALALEIGDLGRARSDPAKLRHCLEHLVSNAGKFTRGGVVTLRGRREGDELVFTVADTGVGIAPKQQRAIFEPFTQTDESAARSGAGLGLAITARIARLLGGAVAVESAPGKGAVFTLRVRADLGAASATGQWPAAALAS